jgi:hypothetical protein
VVSDLGDAFNRLRDSNPAAFRKARAETLVPPKPNKVLAKKTREEHPRAEVVETPPARLPMAMKDVDVPEVRAREFRHPAGLHSSTWAPDDPRHQLPRPNFDPASRRSNFPVYVSPRPARYRPSSSARKAQGYLAYLSRRRVTPSDELGFIPGTTFRLVEE